MNTLSNVNDRRGGFNPPNTGFTSDGILEVPVSSKSGNSHTGVSSLFVPIEKHQWFVLRATYNRAEKELDTLKAHVVYTYLPKHYVLKQTHPPVVVPHSEMLNFIKLTSIKNEHIKLTRLEHCHYKNGDKVRIIDGVFNGVEGRVARVAGNNVWWVKCRVFA